MKKYLLAFLIVFLSPTTALASQGAISISATVPEMRIAYVNKGLITRVETNTSKKIAPTIVDEKTKALLPETPDILDQYNNFSKAYDGFAKTGIFWPPTKWSPKLAAGIISVSIFALLILIALFL